MAAAGLAAMGCQTKQPFINKKANRDICLFSKHLQWLDYDEMAQTVAAIGFDGVDLTVRPGGHVLPENVESDLPKAVSAIKKAGLKVPMMTTRITSAEDAATEKILNTAARTGIMHYRMGYLKYDHSMNITQNLDIHRSTMEKLARMNEKYGLHGAYQNHDKIASIPLMAYSIPITEIKDTADQGYFFMKIKIGQPGTQKEMLKKDKERLSAIHKAIGPMETPYTRNGKLPYYFDANGRYQKRETLLKLLDHARKIGAYDQIAVIEEPFPENAEILVGDLGVRIAADESAHTDEDALKRIEMGYSAIALKAIAKTLSMTMKIAQIACENDVPCFCADLTVNPILVEWNKAVAARLAPFPGLDLGLLETNGHQNYKNWDEMVSYHPCPDAVWRQTQKGVFNLNEDYYQKSGGIFEPSKHYEKMFQE